MDVESLTDLEAAALGCTHAHQPCTAHFIRTQFRVSPSGRFSDSQGSVYPMMRRLEARGLVEAEVVREGRRDVKYYAATAPGRRALKAWLEPPFDASVLVTHDSLRTRMISLALLSPRKRAAWLDAAEEALSEVLATIEAHEPDTKRTALFEELASENARLETEARLAWVRSARRKLARGGLLGA